MGKFPGKPSKIVNRKRIKVSKYSSSRENESVKAAENIYYGLTVFNETFGNEEQVASELKGFSLQETRLTVAEARKHLLEFESICKLHGLIVSRVASFDKEVSEINLDADTKYESSPSNRISKRTRKQQCFDGGGIQKFRRNVSSAKRNISVNLVGNRTSLKNNAAKKILRRAKKSSNHVVVSPDSFQQDKGVCGAIRKFVLPSRSAHSSRVIKPNKRFIEVDDVTSEVSVVRPASAIQLKKPKLILSPLSNSKPPEYTHQSFGFGDNVTEHVQKDNSVNETPQKSFINIPSDFSNNNTSPHSSPDDTLIVEGKRRWKPSYKVQLKLRELNVFGAGTSRFPFKRNLGSSTDASESVNSSSDKDTYSQSASSHTTDDRSESESNSANNVNDEKVGTSSQWSGINPNGSKVILRKARLTLNTHTSSSNEGPFSVSMGCGVSLLPGTVECGVCGAVRFYRFVKQARKFGIFSCESCRKFISKMIKRQACAKGGNLSPLDCHKGGGMCSVPPIVRSQQWKAGRGTLIRCSYKARCPACWLKMCLRSFNMPEQLRSNLAAMLPVEMRNGLVSAPVQSAEEIVVPQTTQLKTGFGELGTIEGNRLASGWPVKTSPLFQRDPQDRGLSRRSKRKAVPKPEKLRPKQDEKDLSRNYRNSRVTHIRSTKLVRKSTKNLADVKEVSNGLSPEEHPRKRRKNCSLKTRKKVEGSIPGRKPGLDNSRRQRQDLKGPRVKHVCRSASIVLGQPVATFPLEPVQEQAPAYAKPEPVKTATKSLCCLDCKQPEIPSTKNQILTKCVSVTSTTEVPPAPSAVETPEIQGEQTLSSSVVEDPSVVHEEPQPPVAAPAYRKLNKLPSLARTLPMPGKRPAPDLQNLVSIDFWESYDPEEVCNTGFGLIGSEPFHVRAICFLCGSGGSEQLIHCASCCEPYHRFCLEDGLRDIWRYNWICQRCTVCHTCGRGQGQQLSCQRCHKTYHSECLGADRTSSRLHSPDRPWVCPSCLRCKSCGVAEVTVFVGNLPLCKGCFKLRQKGNYCPLCQRCYEDHDYDTKMMECGKCSCWVHAKCEGLSDEKYQVLSFLPESVEFVCRMCCVMPPAPWWIAVEEELKAGYLGVLKSLSKNRKACAMLKWSPKKQCSCQHGALGKRLDFSDSPSGKGSESDSSVPQRELQENATNTKSSENAICKGSVENVKTAESSSALNTKSLEGTLIKDGAMNLKPLKPSENSVTVSKPQELISTVLSIENKTDEKIKLETKSDIQKCGSISNLSTSSEMSLPTSELTQIDTSSNSDRSSVTKGSIPDGGFLLDTVPKALSKTDPTLRLWREKFKIKECSVRVQDCLPKPVLKSLLPVKVEVPCMELQSESSFSDNSKSPGKVQQASLATPCSDSGISSTDEELKPCGLAEEATEHAAQENRFTAAAAQTVESAEMGYSSSNGDDNPVSESDGAISETSTNDLHMNKECSCMEQSVRAKPSLTLLSIKKKVNANEYSSLLQFHQEMENLISRSQCLDLQEMYHSTLHEVFPWFDPKYARVSSRPIHEDHFFLSPCKLGQTDSEKPALDDSRTLNDSGKFHDTDQTPSKYFVGKGPDYYYSGLKIEDVRLCVLCKGVGDGLPTEEGRLLYCGQNEWTHTNCALWSAEVFEEIDGSLQNVQSAMSRGRQIRCPWCSKRGASVGCCARNCAETYHFPCARKAHCTFMDDKNVFCPAHAPDAVGKVLHLDSEFDIRRPIYVELDRKKKKFSEVHKVMFMIGSLVVESLGEFVTGASDHPDIIIPIDFRCTRLFWSSVEPWRVVQYHVKTSYQTEKPKPALDLGKNLTVDHTQEQLLVEQKLDEVSRWHQELDQLQGQKTNEITSVQSTTAAATSEVNEIKKTKDSRSTVQGLHSAYKKLPQKTEEDKVACQVVNYLLDTICNRDVDDSCLSDPQNAADILPPDLKDAIFEDLPHDLLDGISMQDIFPKLMSYEDPVVMDIKNDAFGTDGLKEGKEDLNEDVILNSDVDVISAVGRSEEAMLKGKRGEQTVIENDSWFSCGDTKDQVQNFVEDFFQNVCMKSAGQKNGNRELKRSKSEVTPQAVSKKVVGTTRSHQRSCSLTWSCKLDGSGGAQTKRRKATRAVPRSSGEGASNVAMDAHMLQELRLADAGLVTPSIASTAPESVRELKYRLEEDSTSRKTSHPKEEGKENKCLLWHGRAQPRLLHQLDGTVDSSSSSSEGGTSPRQIDEDEVNPFNSGPRRKLQPNLACKDQSEEEPVRCTRCHRTYRTRTSFERHLPTCSSDFILSTSESDSENTRSSEEESSKKHQQSNTEENEEKVTKITSVDKIETETKVQTFSNVKTNVPISHTQVNTTRNIPPQPRPKAPTVNGRLRGRPASRATAQRNSVRMISHTVPAQYHQSHSVVHTQASQTSTAPTVIVQQVPSPSVVPAFVEAFQQQTGQSLQYIATIDAHNNGYNKHPFLTSAPNSLMSGTFQLQTSTDGFTGLQSSGIPVMPGVQLATSQPTVLGTIIQPQPPATIQCVTAEQMVLGSTPGLEMYTDQSGSMFLASQPMFIGLETVVSNTIMSSSQFMSAAMPGVVAASSSFSATTTQVFQASKLEPIMDVPSGFVIVNPHAPLSDTGLRNPEVLTCTPPPPVPMSLPSPMTAPPSIIAQSPVSSVQNAPWRYTAEYSNMDTFVHTNSEFGQFPSQVTSGVRTNNFPVENCNYRPTVTKTTVSMTVPTVVNSIAPQICDTSPQCHVNVIKSSDVPIVSCLPVKCEVPVKSSPPQPLPCPLPTVDREPQQNKVTDTSQTQLNTRPVTVPIVQSKNTTSSKPNSIKLVFQKQSQDGFYKISSQNQNVRVAAGAKPIPVPVQPVGFKSTKPKPRIPPVMEKRKDACQYSPLVLQSNRNVPNGVMNGSKQLQNGKVTGCRENASIKTSPTITYEIRSQDGFSCTSSSITEVWQKVFEAVQEARMIHKMPPLPQNPFGTAQDGLQMLGLKHNALRYLVEQLPGVGRCIKYKPRYHKLQRPSLEDVDALPHENTTGCARSEPFSTRAPYDMFSWLASRHRQPPKFVLPADNESVMSNRRATSSNLPMAMRFRHLKETSKEAVGVYRSHIHGRGLFCLRDIEAGEMVIEYAGEVIRSTLTDKREKLYESKGIGCYMFRIDDQLVVDATMRGNAARFINHSCEPNCYSRVVDILGKKHILIFALRRIPQGEELTYDYKFPFEDVKIPCTCGSRRCRKYLN